MFRDPTIKFNYRPEYPVVEFELVGGLKVAIQNEREGLALFIQGFAEPVAYLDMYYAISKIDNPEAYHRDGAMQIVAYNTVSPGGDPVVYVKFEPTGTRVAFETGVSQVETDAQYGAMYGYAEESADSSGSTPAPTGN